jgi:hypothetical protein
MCNTIFPDLERFCMKNSIDAIQLEPANDFLEKYYESYGFELTDTFSHRMTKRIHHALASHEEDPLQCEP